MGVNHAFGGARGAAGHDDQGAPVRAQIGQVQFAGGGLGRLEEQRDFYAILSEDLVVAIEVADSVVDAEGGVIALPSLNDAHLGWWVEALTNNEVVSGTFLRSHG